MGTYVRPLKYILIDPSYGTVMESRTQLVSKYRRADPPRTEQPPRGRRPTHDARSPHNDPWGTPAEALQDAQVHSRFAVASDAGQHLRATWS
jgi:hypothetical protein